mmetsp:Transcript_15144/g.59291  ORF Transcript_15144/g.59291 Transcript_15144/m.59291 type:complete len:474 (-) Transcript_15144:194-1615(-)
MSRRSPSSSPSGRRRRLRKLSRTGSSSSVESDSSPTSPLVDTRNVFVKFLPPSVTDTVLYEMFSDFGQIISAKVMVDHQTGNSLGYGFVRFYSDEDAAKSIEAMCGKKVGNKTLLCKLSNCPTNPSTANLHPDTNLYIKPLLETTTEEELFRLFSEYGEVEECKVMVDKHTGSSRQIGFVRFSKQEDATTAMTAMNGQRLQPDSSPLIVRYAETDTQRSARKMRNMAKQQQQQPPPAFYQPVYPVQMSSTPPYPMPDGQMYAMGPPMPYGSPQQVHMVPMQPHMSPVMQPMMHMPGGVPYALHTPPGSPTYPMMHSPPMQRVMPSPPMPMMHPHPHQHGSTAPIAIPAMHPQMAHSPLSMSPIPLSPSHYSSMPAGEPNLFVFHLPADVNDEELRKLFEGFGPLESVKVIEDKNTKESKGYGFVKFQFMEDAMRAVASMNGFAVGNKRLKVSFKTSPKNSPHLGRRVRSLSST